MEVARLERINANRRHAMEISPIRKGFVDVGLSNCAITTDNVQMPDERSAKRVLRSEGNFPWALRGDC